MEEKIRLAVFGQKRLSREGGIEIVVKELCTRMAQNGCDVTCYNRAGHHVSGAEYDKTIEYDGIRQKVVPTIEKKGLAAVSSSFFAALCSAFGRYDVVHIHAEGPAFFCWIAAKENAPNAYPFLDVYRKYRKLEEITRPMVVELIEKIEVYEGNRVEITFRFQDEIADLLEELHQKQLGQHEVSA